MSDLDDLELRGSADAASPSGPARQRRPGDAWMAGTLIVAAVAAAAYVAFVWRPKPAPPAAGAKPVAAPAATNSPPLGGVADPIELPPLDATDSLVRTLVQALTESPAVMAWLPTPNLIRNFTVVVTNIAEGATPAKQLKVLRPVAPFRVVARDGRTSTDPRSFERYTTIADAIASVDPRGAARLYATLKPRIEDANRDLGTQQSFDQTLERAIIALLATPVPDAAEPLRPKGIGYAYADPRLESLTPAQKQLLRMGPRNVRVIKGKLREIALALGIPAAHLPPA